MDKSWKRHERKTAELLGGTRVPVHSTSGVKSDVDHKWLAIECKERKSVPDWLTCAVNQAAAGAGEKLPIVVLHKLGERHSNDLVIMSMKDFKDWFVGENDEIPGEN